MYLKNLRLFNFKNFSEKNFTFSEKINCFVGNNGVGKTNVLDAIHYLSLTKSYLNYSDQNNIRFHENFFSVEGNFSDEKTEDSIRIVVQAGQKKVIKRNSKTYEKLSDHIGKYPCVMISPYDRNLISEGSEFRRKFMDGMISQINPDYLHLILRYQKALAQRNALLKLFSTNNYFDAISLEMYDSELIEHGTKIYQIRKEFISSYVPKFCSFYSALSQGEEDVTIDYTSDLEQKELGSLLKENLDKDRAAAYTTRGIHKDDLIFKLFQYPIKKFGSQGQQKSFLVALKLAQLQNIKEYSSKSPVLLMDDIFDKLDDHRVAQLVKLAHEEQFGQIFLSDTHKDRTEKIVRQISSDYLIFEL
ncbi:DNA replication and repair protein RecF [Apibacter sp. B3889]|uniref:DNA replication/repair protein RecF n=1 Tax=unclassified Apibacter TaxID=2630820 RepID=UPI0013231A56|nr:MULTISPECIES: DNA replication and repair protein RecF [unclassified Apibacter]MXO33984.1 DNA replication and repair protein RecF [Apibacter sp. B3883]MXO41885.1 DNA replication and repair protein RecF [Apibacter sp. B3889]MXP03455.1 DNA replication and repair protein RecF [Apibacter sp. B3887]MXP07282.1 DNA replication and repair protein RecF [Apibacter sp. B3935]